jgi:hypothetical protein
MVDMIEKNGLIHRHPAEEWKDGKEEGFGLKMVAIVCHDREKKNNDKNNKNEKSLFHIPYLYGKDFKSVKKKSL